MARPDSVVGRAIKETQPRTVLSGPTVELSAMSKKLIPDNDFDGLVTEFSGGTRGGSRYHGPTKIKNPKVNDNDDRHPEPSYDGALFQQQVKQIAEEVKRNRGNRPSRPTILDKLFDLE